MKENMIGIVYTHTYGAGFSTWNDTSELNQNLAHAIEFEDMLAIKDILVELECSEYLEPEELSVVWVEKGTNYRIDEYDGSETVVLPMHLDKTAI